MGGARGLGGATRGWSRGAGESLARHRVAGFPAWGGARGSRARISSPIPTPSPAAPRRSLPWGARSRPARVAVLSQGPLPPGPQTRSGSPALWAGRAMVVGSQVSEAGPPGSRGKGRGPGPLPRPCLHLGGGNSQWVAPLAAHVRSNPVRRVASLLPKMLLGLHPPPGRGRRPGCLRACSCWTAADLSALSPGTTAVLQDH